MIYSLPLMVVIVFLIFTLIVGLYYSRKTTTLKEYAIGRKNFSTAALVATVLATTFGGGGLIRTVEQVHVEGLFWIILMSLATVGMWFFSKLAPRMAIFMENLSLAETIGQVYGKLPRIITALASICGSIAFVAIQVNVIIRAISICVGDVDPAILAVLATLILIFYSTFGGIRAVTITDVLQCMTFMIILPCLAWLMFLRVNQSFTYVFTTLSAYEKFQFGHVLQWNRSFITIISITLSCIISCIGPSQIQRIYMSSNVIQARKVFWFSSIFSTGIISIILLIGIFTFVASPNLPQTAIWPAITANLSPVFKGFLVISLLAMAMSTADSDLNTCSVMCINDIVGTLSNRKISSTLQLRFARITSFSVGILAMLLTFYKKDLLDLLLLGNSFFIPIASAPLLLAIFGFRSSSRTALIGMATGVITILLWSKFSSYASQWHSYAYSPL